MRSRPDLRVQIHPARPVVGSTFEVRAQLQSHSVTPIDRVEFTFSGVEHHYVRGAEPSTSRTLLVQTGHTEPARLGIGAYDYRAQFRLEPGLPPTHQDALGGVGYTLGVRVTIPWWPDRHEQYTIVVALPPYDTAAQPPKVFASRALGPAADGIYLEATLDPGSAAVGRALSGAVSVTSDRSIASVTLSLVAKHETRPRGVSAEVRRLEFELPCASEARGDALYFSVAIPATESPSFETPLMRFQWQLEIRANARQGPHSTLIVPLVVAPQDSNTHAGDAHRLPPLGRERRASVWGFVAQEHAFVADTDHETMTSQIGDIDIRITVEQRADGLYSVASLHWPSAEIGLLLRERRFTDVFTKTVPLDDTAFDERFVVVGREPRQVRALLSDRALAAR